MRTWKAEVEGALGVIWMWHASAYYTRCLGGRLLYRHTYILHICRGREKFQRLAVWCPPTSLCRDFRSKTPPWWMMCCQRLEYMQWEPVPARLRNTVAISRAGIVHRGSLNDCMGVLSEGGPNRLMPTDARDYATSLFARVLSTPETTGPRFHPKQFNQSQPKQYQDIQMPSLATNAIPASPQT